MNCNGSPRIAVFEADDGILELYRELVDGAGMGTLLDQLRLATDAQEVEAFLRGNDPWAVIWDIAPPYDQACRLLRDLRESGDFDGRTVIVTTTNKELVETLIGAGAPVVAKPFDINELEILLRDAFAAARPPPVSGDD